MANLLTAPQGVSGLQNGVKESDRDSVKVDRFKRLSPPHRPAKMVAAVVD
jgi:hypothetical protein